MSEWETFCDKSYYHLWRVRRKNERGFDDGYHIHNGEEARALVELLNGLESERDALQEQLDAAIMLGKMQERRHERELEQVRLASAAERMLGQCRQSPTTEE